MLTSHPDIQKRDLTRTQKDFLEQKVLKLQADKRIVGVAIGGSFLLDEMDEFSDLDLVIYVDPDHNDSVIADRENIAKRMGDLLECFTGEHVGETRLLICLYGPPLLHVDLKFVSMGDIDDKIETPVVLWERTSELSKQLNRSRAEFPQPDPSWIEKRFWVWVHYTATKIGRGELFEAVDAIGFLRNMVLGPLLLQKHGVRPQGLRKLEKYISPHEREQMKSTIPTYSKTGCVKALEESIILYRVLCPVDSQPAIERWSCAYLKEIKAD